MLSRMFGIYSTVEGICRHKEIDYKDMWDSFSTNRNQLGRDAMHLNRVGKT